MAADILIVEIGTKLPCAAQVAIRAAGPRPGRTKKKGKLADDRMSPNTQKIMLNFPFSNSLAS